LPNVIRIIKSKRVRLVEHTASTGDKKSVYKIFVGKLEGKRPLP
jgi:hypothetical protein